MGKAAASEFWFGYQLCCHTAVLAGQDQPEYYSLIINDIISAPRHHSLLTSVLEHKIINNIRLLLAYSILLLEQYSFDQDKVESYSLKIPL